MNEPAIPPDPAASSPAPAAPPAKSVERTRIFTPMESDPTRLPKGLRHVTPLAAWDGDELESPDEETPSVKSTRIHDPSKPPLPSLVPNATIPFLLRLQRRSDPHAIDRRIALGARALAVAALAALIALAVGSSFLFQPDTSNQAVSGQKPTAAPPAAGTPSLSPAESAEAVREALELLETFLQTDSAETRQATVGSAEVLPAPLARESRNASTRGATIDRDRARLHHAGNLKVVLAPVIHTTGLPHTAAVVHQGDRWRVDWRSVVTPEPVEWDHLVKGTPHGPSQFRVLLSHLPDGTWTVTRPGTGQAAITVAPSPRVATDLAEAGGVHPGSSVAVDVYLQAGSSQELNIVDWTKDKWSL